MSALLDMQKADKNIKDREIFNFFLEKRLIPMPVTHQLSKIASLWKIHQKNLDRNFDSEWAIKPHQYDGNKEWKISTDELYKLIFLQPIEPTEGEKQQMVERMELELAEFMVKPHESTFPDDTHDKCQKTLGQVLEFLESRYNTVYTQLARSRNAKRNKKPKAKHESKFKIGKKRCPPGCVKRKVSRKVSRKRRSVKRSRKKVIGGKMRTIHKSKNPIPYDEDWAKGFVTHIGPGGGGGRNNYTGAKKVPTRRILDARKKLIDKIYLLHDHLVALDSSLVKDMFTGEVLNPFDWRDPPQYMDRDELKQYVKTMKIDLKYEKQQLKKSHKFSAGKQEMSVKKPKYTAYAQCYKRDPKRPGGGLFGHGDPKCLQKVAEFKKAAGLTVDFDKGPEGTPSIKYL